MSVFKIMVLTALFALSAIPRSIAESVSIVDFGAKLGSGLYRGDYVKSYNPHIDRDGNGTLTNDFVSSWYYSDTTPLNPDGLDFDTNTLNGVFYGGVTLYTACNLGKRNISEGHLNQNHEFYDDLNLMTLPAPRTNELLEAYAVYYWPKSGFLNGGAANTVTFDTNSAIAVEITRYWGGVNAGRWLVRDGNQFYLSEATFAGETQQFYVASVNYTNNPVWRNTHIIHPLATRWAPYTPVPDTNYVYEIDFNPSDAVFTDHSFSNVTAVGFFIERYLTPPYAVSTALTLNEPIAVKWGSVRAEAVVDGTEKPARNLEMANIGGTYFASNTVSYELWRKIFRFAVRRQYVEDMGLGTYSLEKDGSMGMMRADGQPHNGLEPVTDITWYDAAAWCNALSEFEGKEPCYYTDPSYTNVLRVVVYRDKIETWTNRPVVYWKTNSAGFRLPTGAEWSRFSSGSQTTFWEYIWFPSGNIADPAVETNRTVLGRNMTAPTNSILMFNEHPWDGTPRITFRPVRNGASSPVLGESSGSAIWSFAPTTILSPAEILPGYQLRSTITQLLTEVTLNAGLANTNHITDKGFNPFSSITTGVYSVEFGATEIPYSLWNLVAQWAVDNGYSFNYSGDMGSMGNTPGETYFEQSEPVTQISWYDALVWCNALSEIMHRQPVYFKDVTFTNVWRQANEFRLETFLGAGYPRWPDGVLTPYDTASYIPVFMNIAANGYRMPLPQEWDLANTTNSNSGTDAYNWLVFNASGKTHRVATKLPNPSGVHDMEGNVRELTWGDSRANINNATHRKGSHFARGYNTSHPTIDIAELPCVGRTHVGLRTLRLSAANPSYETVSVSPAAITVIEGSTNQISVQLSMQPSSVVTVTVSYASGDSDIIIESGDRLLFDENNWNIDQPVVLHALSDADGANGQTLFSCSADGINSVSVVATEQDINPQIIISTNAVFVTEGETSAVNISLNIEPVGSLTVAVQRVSGDANLNISGDSSFVFTAQNWNLPATVVVSAAEDPDQSNGTAVFSCTAPGALPASFTANEVDNDYALVASGLLAAWNLQSISASAAVSSTNAYFLATGLVYSAAGGVLTHSQTNRAVGKANALAFTYTGGQSTLAGALAYGSYFKWGLDPEPGCLITITNISIVTDNENAAMISVLMSSATGVSETNELGRTPGGLIQRSSFAVSNISDAAQSIEFRLYAYGDSIYRAAVIGDMYSSTVENDIAIYGTIARTGSTGITGDADNDGLPDEWETQYFGSTASVHPDDLAANRFNSVREAYIAGFDPTDSAGGFVVNSLEKRNDSIIFWTAASGRVYNVYWSSNLLSGFSLIVSNLTHGIFTDAVHGVHDQGFYRIGVQISPQ